MALTQREQDAINQLSADITAALDALRNSTQGLRDQITALETVRDQLIAANTADEGQIADLTTAITGLRATLDTQESDVVDALTGLDNSVKAVTP